MMKKSMILTISLLLVIGAVNAESITRTISPSRIAGGESVTVTFNIATESPKGFALSDSMPSGWSLSEWSVSGFSQDYITVTTTGRNIDVEFDTSVESLSSATFTYTATAPSTEAAYSFGPYLYAQSTPTAVGQERAIPSVTVRTITCGDGFCENAENCSSCVSDCGCSSGYNCEADVCVAVPVEEVVVTSVPVEEVAITQVEEKEGTPLWFWLLIGAVLVIAVLAIIFRQKIMGIIGA